MVAKRGMLEMAKHLVDQHGASMLDELTVDRESPLHLAAQAGSRGLSSACRSGCSHGDQERKAQHGRERGPTGRSLPRGAVSSGLSSLGHPREPW